MADQAPPPAAATAPEVKKNSLALVLLYNHNYEKNIPRLENLYASRFSVILHLMPFYTGTQKNVISVYENSYRFHGYITQARQALLHTGCDTFVVAADDLLIHPDLCEKTLLNALDIPPDSCYLPLRPLVPDLFHHLFYWGPAKHGLKFFHNARGSEGIRFLPDREEALALISRHLPHYSPVAPASYFFRNVPPDRDLPQQLPYPLCSAYPDFCILRRPMLPLFAHYCGIFSSLNLFVGIALATALAFSTEKIATLFGNGYTGMTNWRGARQEFRLLYDARLDKLLQEFPHTAAFVHPVKLSEWK
jgi:hypothetical protein